jgi:hypothetical protein
MSTHVPRTKPKMAAKVMITTDYTIGIAYMMRFHGRYRRLIPNLFPLA